MNRLFYGRAFALLVVLALLIGGGLFFWYEYRPAKARERCSAEAVKRADKDPFVYEIVYRHCLRTHGIEYCEQKEQKD
ncbi:MAG TPA: hypothetical protein VMH06_03870 [Thermodesulfovibrionales bacterium]|nr:hypothetical protein [Thermodesulfovibrionales bacterium]